MRKFVPTLIIQFANNLQPHEITQFRGAVIASLNEKNILFHNHKEQGQRYSYPLIQYKIIHQKAAIVCIGEGTKAINELFNGGKYEFHIGNRNVKMLIESINTSEQEICWAEGTAYYKLHNWLPLNSKNYQLFQTTELLSERVKILEDILTANILSMLKGESIDIHLDQHLLLNITAIKEQHIIIYKGIKMMAFDIEFKANILLPDYIGLGKSCSVGYGTLTRATN